MSELLPRFENAVEVHTAVEDVRDEIKRRELAIAAVKKARLGTTVINEAVGGKIVSMIHLADVVDQGQAGGWIARAEDGRRKSSESEDILTLPDLGLDAPRVHEARKLRERYNGNLRELLDDANEKDKPLSYSGLLTTKPESSYELRRSQLSSEWYTPAYVIEAARRVLGEIDLDPASCEEANATVQAATFYTEDDDGLAHSWFGRVWLNPPYQGLAGAFARKLATAYAEGEIKAGILLITALTTDTTWFRSLWDGLLCFTYGRIKFDGEGGQSNTAGSVFVYLGSERERFVEEFAGLGEVVVSWRNR